MPARIVAHIFPCFPHTFLGFKLQVIFRLIWFDHWSILVITWLILLSIRSIRNCFSLGTAIVIGKLLPPHSYFNVKYKSSSASLNWLESASSKFAVWWRSQILNSKPVTLGVRSILSFSRNTPDIHPQCVWTKKSINGSHRPTRGISSCWLVT